MSVKGKKLLSLAEKLAMLPDAATPQKLFANGHPVWRKPLFSKRKLADLRKEALAAGHDWPLPEKEERAPGKSFHETRIFFSKGHKFEREKPARQEDIRKKMEEMPKRIEEWKKLKQGKKQQQTELQRILSNKITY